MRQRWRLCEIRAEEYMFVLLSRFLNQLDGQVSLMCSLLCITYLLLAPFEWQFTAHQSPDHARKNRNVTILSYLEGYILV